MRATFSRNFFAKFLSDYFSQTLSLAKFDAFCGEWRSANGAQIWRISTYIIGINIIDEIEWRFFSVAVRRRIFAWRTKFGKIDPRRIDGNIKERET